MSQISAKLRDAQNDGRRNLTFYCPGCDSAHQVRVEGPGSWTWDGNRTAPTFTPSVLVEGTEWLTDDEYARVLKGETVEPTPTRCHSFVKGGQIQFLADCTHSLKGKTVPLPDLPTWLCDSPL